MFAPKKIAVAVDVDVGADAELARRLVDAACDVAALFDASLTLIHVALPVASPLVPVDTYADAYRAMVDVVDAKNAAAQESLAALCTRAVARGRRCDARFITDAGNVPELVVAAAQDIHAGMLVVATHARRGIARVVLGSVAERIAHRAPMPVMLLPPHP